jgi:hypothetical protein
MQNMNNDGMEMMMMFWQQCSEAQVYAEISKTTGVS